jgi:hypothetical protein
MSNTGATPTAFLIVDPNYGVYLGSHAGRGYWSKVDADRPAGSGDLSQS